MDCLPNHEHWVCFYLFMSSSVSLSNVFIFILLLFFLIEVQQTYNIIIVSGVMNSIFVYCLLYMCIHNVCIRKGNGTPLLYSCLENSMDRRAWQATVPGVARVGHNLETKPPPWRSKWQPTPVFLPGKVHGQRSLAGCSPWGYMTEHACRRVEGDRLVAINWQNFKTRRKLYNKNKK